MKERVKSMENKEEQKENNEMKKEHEEKHTQEHNKEKELNEKLSKVKDELEDVKDSVIDDIGKQLEKKDSNLYYKALIKMRKDANIEFSDSGRKKKYDEYCGNYK